MEGLPRVTRRHVRGASAVLTAIGVAYTWDAFQLPLGDPIGTGSGAMPAVIGLIWVACAAYLTLCPFEVSTYDEEVGSWPNREMMLRILIVLVLCFGFVFLLPKLGMIVMSAIFMTLMGRISGASWPAAFASSVSLAAAFWIIFVYFLQLRLPYGTWMASVWAG